MSEPRPNLAWIRARLTRLLAIPAIASAGVLLVACGGSSAPSNTAASEQAQEQQAETQFADFAKCMREHGVGAEAATMPGGGHGLKVRPGPGGPGGMEAAEKACARYRPEPKRVNLSPQQKVELEERVQKFAKCMREHGIKVETSTKGGGVQIGIRRSGSGGSENGPNPESPAFQEAQKDCQSFLPAPPGGGPRRSGPFGAGNSKGLSARPGAGLKTSGG